MGEDSKRYVTLSEVMDIITTEAQERELSYEQTLSLSHAEKFVVLEPEDSKKLAEELDETFEFMNRKLAYKTADILPQDANGVKAIFSRDRYTPSEEDAGKIIEIIKKYL